ncbi:G patch domain and ankyrin repeat-containing protein 1 [Phytophthora pseudosyringae]|uniref:G patch domain and ankyrin repeat-containing protein 1 n=1 Tax=Phytophthora pseudosyringae TaxID=221518 RepID=A0A8T1VLV0_9STRA|nr:G patch domain and ankyrin repeat-containing protein 1 [Phytophthora pseudosyringae]
MWQVAVLTRFEALQSFLSGDERESVRLALFEQRGAAQASAEASEPKTEGATAEAETPAAGGSAHLERWRKWKLQGDKIDELTSTAGTGADDALKLLEATVADLRFFARGKRGVLFAGEMRSSDEPVVAKLAADATSAGSVTLEARWLRVVNRMGIGARLLDAGGGWFLCERLEGRNVVEFLGERDEVTTSANVTWVVREMLCQCFAMDLMGVNKEEMTHPHRHIIVHRSTQQPVRWRCTFVDFEKCSSTKKPKNVTQLCQFLSSPRMVALLASKRVKVDVPKLRQCTKRYKQNISTQTFGDIMRVFGL